MYKGKKFWLLFQLEGEVKDFQIRISEFYVENL